MAAAPLESTTTAPAEGDVRAHEDEAVEDGLQNYRVSMPLSYVLESRMSGAGDIKAYLLVLVGELCDEVVLDGKTIELLDVVVLEEPGHPDG